MVCVISIFKLTLIDVKTLREERAVKMCFVPREGLTGLLWGLLIYASLNNEKIFPTAYCQKFN